MARLKINLDKLENIALFLFLCARHAHQTDEMFDVIFLRLSFTIYMGLVVLRIFHNHYIKINSYCKWTLTFIGYILITCLWANPEYSLTYVPGFIQIVGLSIGVSTQKNTQQKSTRFLSMYYCSLIYMVVLLVLKSPLSDWGTTDIGSALGMWKNVVGLHSATGAILSIYYIGQSRKKYFKVINSIIFVIFTVVSLLSGSRKALFMVPLAVVIYFWVSKKRKLNIKEFSKTIVAVLAIIVVIILGYILIMNNELFYQAIGRRVDSMINTFFYGGKEVSIDERAYYISKAKELFLNSLRNVFFGAGSNGFVSYMDEIGYSHVAYCHNNFWELLCTLGIVGFSIFYYMQVKCLFLVSPFNLNNGQIRNLFAVLWTSLLLVIIFGWWLVYYHLVSFEYLFLVIFTIGSSERESSDTKKERLIRNEDKSA